MSKLEILSCFLAASLQLLIGKISEQAMESTVLDYSKQPSNSLNIKSKLLCEYSINFDLFQLPSMNLPVLDSHFWKSPVYLMFHNFDAKHSQTTQNEFVFLVKGYLIVACRHQGSTWDRNNQTFDGQCEVNKGFFLNNVHENLVDQIVEYQVVGIHSLVDITLVDHPSTNQVACLLQSKPKHIALLTFPNEQSQQYFQTVFGQIQNDLVKNTQEAMFLQALFR